MALEFAEHADVVFERAPLIRVLCQIRFSPILSLLHAVGATGFQTAIRDVYPVMLPAETNASISVTPTEVGVEAQAPVWRFADEGKQWTVGLAVNFVSLETPTYSHIGEFLERFAHILSALHRTLRPSDSVRVGLRKVNLFEVKGRFTHGFHGVIRPELLGPLAVNDFPTPILGSFGHLLFKDDDNTLAIRHGLVNDEVDPGAPDEVPDRLRFVLDMDYFTERPQSVDGTGSVIQLLRYFSDGMTNFFHWAVEDAHKMDLGPQARDRDGGGDQ